MIMTVKRPKFASALIMMEVMVAMAVLTIATLGVLSHQYHALGHARIARAQIAAMRTAQLLLEDWKSTGGSKEYDVTMLGLGFSQPLQVPSQWSQGQGVGLGAPLHNSAHSITIDGLPMVMVLTWQDVSQDTIAEVILRQLAVTVMFGEVDGRGDLVFPESYLSNIQPVIMTTYTRLDAAGG